MVEISTSSMNRTGVRHAAGSVAITAFSMSSRRRNSPGSAGNELVAELGAPSRMGKVAGRDHPDTLAARPGGEVLEIEIPAGGARVFRVDVQVRVEGHPMPRLLVGVRPTPPRCRVMAEDDTP